MEVGTVVHLKSGGPKMTIERFGFFNRQAVLCSWFLHHSLRKQWFVRDALVKDW